MSSGLLALLDDVTLIARAAAASLDDASAQAFKAGTKSAGVVIDDTAVTPSYVTGLAAQRELPIVARIARGSLINKLVILLPGALALSVLAPWAVQPILMLGGLFLCFEGAEKVHHWIAPAAHHKTETDISVAPQTPEAMERFEDRKVRSAVKTDLILSAEIMAITLSALPATSPIHTKAIALALVGLFITLLVYGAVALIVKADDAGVAMARSGSRIIAAAGRGLVRIMPGVLTVLATVGTLAMLWVGGGIVLHSLEVFGLAAPAHLLHDIAAAAGHAIPTVGGAIEWLLTALGSGLFGLGLGALLVPVVDKAVMPLVGLIRRD
ncbi:DUF808 domain-containing protein [Rhodovulum adriaticum]|uniref:Inner membrane protein YedI n=1 Tax=Rhodovulum adriaticum TaxID=35804 RepID=A0A4R2NMF8_RHOAD|nr:DUF808 domain-containing protein [Rhodovulum adriaticum]MBK1636360.1 ABC transporter [Rhodovulum adriaticum]TCP22849.1 hypothetical protein EV656_105151 [Rhodovulum adriaticum]